MYFSYNKKYTFTYNYIHWKNKFSIYEKNKYCQVPVRVLYHLRWGNEEMIMIVVKETNGKMKL